MITTASSSTFVLEDRNLRESIIHRKKQRVARKVVVDASEARMSKYSLPE